MATSPDLDLRKTSLRTIRKMPDRPQWPTLPSLPSFPDFDILISKITPELKDEEKISLEGHITYQ